MRRLQTILALGAFFVLSVALAACGSSSGVPTDSVAVVAGNNISVKTFDHWMYVAAKGQSQASPGQPVIVPNDPPNFTKCVAQVRKQIPSLAKTPAKTVKADCKQLFTSLSAQVMDFLIKAFWYQADAHKLGLKVSNADIQASFTKAKNAQFSTPAQFQTFLTSSGQTLQDILYRVRINQLYLKLIAKHPTIVTPAAIAAYYSAHQAQFGTPASRDMRIVLTKTQAEAQAALKALKGGRSFDKVAKKYSIDPTTKKTGGLLTNVVAGQQDAALNQAAFAAKPNQLLGPIKGQFGYYVFEVTKITPAKLKSLTASTTLIKQTLATQLQTSAQTAVDAHARKNWLKQTSCNSTYTMADCNGYKAPKSSTLGTAPVAP